MIRTNSVCWEIFTCSYRKMKLDCRNLLLPGTNQSAQRCMKYSYKKSFTPLVNIADSKYPQSLRTVSSARIKQLSVQRRAFRKSGMNLQRLATWSTSSRAVMEGRLLFFASSTKARGRPAFFSTSTPAPLEKVFSYTARTFFVAFFLRLPTELLAH